MENALALSKALVLLMNVEVKGGLTLENVINIMNDNHRTPFRSPSANKMDPLWFVLKQMEILCEVKSFAEIRQEMGNQCLWLVACGPSSAAVQRLPVVAHCSSRFTFGHIFFTEEVCLFCFGNVRTCSDIKDCARK